ncbi:MAG: putative endonuclease, archaeal Holliday junction resolvase like protein [Acidobacteria bacterium OLB17]|nr:MAG: putative endonuclease, archaeal Holliday junction resolvase like protein [Acidobacteria bacterium OLB17]MCZ2391844.1 YraN family protein [Acidobacteriota bacterium]
MATQAENYLLGARGEALASAYLQSCGYRIVVTNFKVPVGRNRAGAAVTGEIDIIALDGRTLCFIEVKTRRSEELVPAIAAVDRQKMRQITRTARVYRRIFGVRDMPVRYDVVTVLAPRDGEPTITLTKAFWNEAALKKRTWASDRWMN